MHRLTQFGIYAKASSPPGRVNVYIANWMQAEIIKTRVDVGNASETAGMTTALLLAALNIHRAV